MMTHEVPELFGTRPHVRVRHLAPLDNVVLLQYLRGGSEVKRAIAVLKTRGRGHDAHLRQLDITSEAHTHLLNGRPDT
jgi:circadian clock protein KaiC